MLIRQVLSVAGATAAIGFAAAPASASEPVATAAARYPSPEPMSRASLYQPRREGVTYGGDGSGARSEDDQSSVDPQPVDLESGERRWRIHLSTWIWAAGIEGTAGARGRLADVNVGFDDLINDADSIFGFAGRLEIGIDSFAFFLDGFYSEFGVDNASGPLGLSEIDFDSSQATLDVGAMYRVAQWEPRGAAAGNRHVGSLYLYGGARFSDLELELDPALLPARSDSRTWIDPIVGAKAVLPISERWGFSVNGDIGGFGVSSDLTWSATAVLGYDFELFSAPATVLFGYRAYGWDYSDGSGNDKFVWDVIQHGPIIGLSLQF